MEQKLPPITFYILITNVLVFVTQQVLGVDLNQKFGFYSFSSHEMGLFSPVQILTHLFLHANFMHILGNMMGLYFFGPVLEQTLGKNKFLILYFGAGLGGVFLNGLVNYLEISKLLPSSIEYQIQMATPMIGASGAIFGILAAFTKLFPNIKMMIFPIPFEIKAKYLIPLYAAFEIYSGFFRKDSNIGHFAHIGGLIVGIILIIYWFGWKKKIY